MPTEHRFEDLDLREEPSRGDNADGYITTQQSLQNCEITLGCCATANYGCSGAC